MTIDTLTFNGRTPLDLLLFRAYGAEIPGLLEAVLLGNPGLAAAGPIPAKGTTIRVVTPAPVARRQTVRKVIKLYD